MSQKKNPVIKCVSVPHCLLFVWETLPRVTTRMTSNDELCPRAPIGYDDWGRVSENRTRKRHNKNTNTNDPQSVVYSKHQKNDKYVDVFNHDTFIHNVFICPAHQALTFRIILKLIH